MTRGPSRPAHLYRLLYWLDLEPGSFTKEEAAAAPPRTIVKAGATDALSVLSMLYPKDGSYSQAEFTIDGRNEGRPLSAKEAWKAWLVQGLALAENPELDEGRRMICQSVRDTTRAMFGIVEQWKKGERQ